MTANNNNLHQLVGQLLQSPDFITGLESAIRNVNSASNNPASSSNINPASSSNINPAPAANTTPSTNFRERTSFGSIQDEVRRFFPSIRQPDESAQNSRVVIPNNSNICNNQPPKKRKKLREAHPSFTRDVILLQSPNCKKTITGKRKAEAFLQGLAVKNVVFEKKWDLDHIKQHVRNLFAALPASVDFEIVVPMNGLIVPFALPPGILLCGDNMCRTFYQKPVYVRPLQPLQYEELQIISSGEEDDFNLDNNSITHFAVVSTQMENTITPLNCEMRPINVAHGANEDGEDEDVDVQQLEADTALAIENSLASTSSCVENARPNETIESLLGRFRSRINQERITHFNINRDNVLDGCFRAMNRKTFSPYNRVDVMFSDVSNISEGAVDHGGPTREMFRLILSKLQYNSNIFQGNDNSKSLTLNRDALQNNRYFHTARIICMSLIHGGPAANFFSENLFMAIASGPEAMVPTMSEICDDEVRIHFNAIQLSSNLENLQLAMTRAESLLQMCGCQMFISDFQKKGDILNGILQFILVERIQPSLSQFCNGFESMGLLSAIQQNSDLFKNVFCFSGASKLSAASVIQLFKPDLNELGSNRRADENRTIAFWRDYLQDCEEGEAEAKLGDVLAFATGLDSIPPLGFPEEPSVGFLHTEVSLYPTANTCSLTMMLPVVHAQYEDFKFNMDFGILNGMVFAFA